MKIDVHYFKAHLKAWYIYRSCPVAFYKVPVFKSHSIFRSISSHGFHGFCWVSSHKCSDFNGGGSMWPIYWNICFLKITQLLVLLHYYNQKKKELSFFKFHKIWSKPKLVLFSIPASPLTPLPASGSLKHWSNERKLNLRGERETKL